MGPTNWNWASCVFWKIIFFVVAPFLEWDNCGWNFIWGVFKRLPIYLALAESFDFWLQNFECYQKWWLGTFHAPEAQFYNSSGFSCHNDGHEHNFCRKTSSSQKFQINWISGLDKEANCGQFWLFWRFFVQTPIKMDFMRDRNAVYRITSLK